MSTLPVCTWPSISVMSSSTSSMSWVNSLTVVNWIGPRCSGMLPLTLGWPGDSNDK